MGPIVRVGTIAEVAEEWGTTDIVELRRLAQAEHDTAFDKPGRVSVTCLDANRIEFRIVDHGGA